MILLYRQGDTTAQMTSKLRFWVRFSDPYFFHYTDGPLGVVPGSVYYFTTKDAGTAAEGQPVPLNNPWTAIAVRTPFFDYPVTPDVTGVTIVNQDNGNTYFSATVQKAGATSVPVNLSGAPEGMYTLNDGTQTVSFFLAQKTAAAVPAALLEIDLAGTGSVSYSLAFSPRQTIWKYQLIPGSTNGGKQYAITSGNGVTFSPSTTDPVSGNPQIVSEQPIALLQVPKLRLQLVEMNGDSGSSKKVLIPDLPSPPPANLRPGPSTDINQVYSETYVYL
jgi:hypothetical protein